jgi:AbiJ N-terminal domain 3
MNHNPGDWTVEHLFGEIGAFDCSRARFAAMIEDAVHPLARSGDEQLRIVAALNKVLTRDGYHLVPEGEESVYPIFAFRPVVRGVAGRPKNFICASRGPKPEIGFADAINNDTTAFRLSFGALFQSDISILRRSRFLTTTILEHSDPRRRAISFFKRSCARSSANH